MTNIGKYGMGKRRGPYGTNEGDVWLGGGWMQERLDREQPGDVLIHEMMVKDGELQECLYVTPNLEMIAEAKEGHVRYVAAQANKN